VDLWDQYLPAHLADLLILEDLEDPFDLEGLQHQLNLGDLEDLIGLLVQQLQLNLEVQ
jgi:hypothetical protein